MEKRKAVFHPLPHFTQIYMRMQRKMVGENGQSQCEVMGTLSRVPEVRRPSGRVLSCIPDTRASPPLPQILPPHAPIDEVPPFILLVLRG